jgi:hypothetical protein
MSFIVNKEQGKDKEVGEGVRRRLSIAQNYKFTTYS